MDNKSRRCLDRTDPGLRKVRYCIVGLCMGVTYHTGDNGAIWKDITEGRLISNPILDDDD